jgi:hypothetical protein
MTVNRREAQRAAEEENAENFRDLIDLKTSLRFFLCGPLRLSAVNSPGVT